MHVLTVDQHDSLIVAKKKEKKRTFNIVNETLAQSIFSQ